MNPACPQPGVRPLAEGWVLLAIRSHAGPIPDEPVRRPTPRARGVPNGTLRGWSGWPEDADGGRVPGGGLMTSGIQADAGHRSARVRLQP